MTALRLAAGAMLVLSVAINFANIIGRYFLSVSIPWAEEVMLFLMIGCVFLNCGPVGWSGRQIRMDAFVSLLPPRPDRARSPRRRRRRARAGPCSGGAR